MSIIPLPFAVFDAGVGFDTRRVFDVHTAYVIAERRLPPAVRAHLTGILRGIVPSGNRHTRSWKFAFKDIRVTKGGGAVLVWCTKSIVPKTKLSAPILSAELMSLNQVETNVNCAPI